MECRSHRAHNFFQFRAAEPSEGIGGELEIRDGTTVQSRRQVEVSQLLGPVFRHLSALPKPATGQSCGAGVFQKKDRPVQKAGLMG